MSIVKHTDKRSGITYVYESESYWDKEKKQPRSKRTLIGKIDEATGEIIPTGKSGKKKEAVSSTQESGTPPEAITDQVELLAQKDAQISSLREENRKLLKENSLDEMYALGSLVQIFSCLADFQPRQAFIQKSGPQIHFAFVGIFHSPYVVG